MAGEYSDNPFPLTPKKPTLAGFNTDLFSNNNSHSSNEEEVALDPEIIRDEVDEVHEGKDLYNDNFLDDYKGLENQDHDDSMGLEESMEDERDLDKIIQDRWAAELELDTRDARLSSRKLLHLFRDQDTDEDNFRPSKQPNVLGAEWGKVNVVGTSELPGSYVEQRA